MTVQLHISGQGATAMRIEMERASQRLIIAFVLSGLFFMLLPGTFLGVWNLIDISEQHTISAMSPAWLQAHGQAQIFGWVGSFILGIGFYSLTKMQTALSFPERAGWITWSLWTSAVALHWIIGVSAWHWRMLLPFSATLQLIAFSVFYRSLRRHQPVDSSHRAETWMQIVICGTIAFLVAMVINLAAFIHLALYGNSPALPHVLDQQLIVLAVWGVLVPTIWGFNARWLPIFAGFRKPDRLRLLLAYGLSVAAVLAFFLEWWAVSAVIFFFAGIQAVEALHVWQPAVQPAKLLHIHRSFPFFLRLAYVWLIVSAILSALAVLYDRSGGIWGASRHALTVGFVAAMVFTIGPRILPAFCGMRVLWSTRLMFASLLLLNLGCTLRVVLEPMAYEGYWRFAWKLLPYSAITELTAVVLFAWNIFATLLQPPAHLRSEVRPASRSKVAAA